MPTTTLDLTLHDYETGEYIREAVLEEAAASFAASHRDGGAGVIHVHDNLTVKHVNHGQERALRFMLGVTRLKRIESGVDAYVGGNPFQLVRSDLGDGGWSLHDAKDTDDEIAEGLSVVLASGESGYPSAEDYLKALTALAQG